LRQLRVEGAGVLPAQHIERLHQFADAVGLRAKHSELNDLFIAEMIFQLVVDFVLVYCVLALFEKVCIAQRSLFAHREIFAGVVRAEEIVDHVLG
jgi:hypothetical protein